MQYPKAVIWMVNIAMTIALSAMAYAFAQAGLDFRDSRIRQNNKTKTAAEG